MGRSSRVQSLFTPGPQLWMSTRLETREPEWNKKEMIWRSWHSIRAILEIVFLVVSFVESRRFSFFYLNLAEWNQWIFVDIKSCCNARTPPAHIDHDCLSIHSFSCDSNHQLYAVPQLVMASDSQLHVSVPIHRFDISRLQRNCFGSWLLSA